MLEKAEREAKEAATAVSVARSRSTSHAARYSLPVGNNGRGEIIPVDTGDHRHAGSLPRGCKTLENALDDRGNVCYNLVSLRSLLRLLVGQS